MACHDRLGVVQGVDEETACCWLECAVCACQDLLERSGLPYFCPVCQDDVTNPITKTNLDVIIKCDIWRDARVTVKLLQATIEKLLPVSYRDSDQGYDIERVLGKRLGPLYCYIEEHGELTAKLSEIVV
ncbi:DNA repair-scaffolding protein [Exaiptasia diaphana]|nr:DNA repair-scaffolding protein [Exaiptasia diaphana]